MPPVFFTLRPTPESLSDDQIRSSMAALERTIGFFANEWRRHHWKYENTISEEVIPYMLIEMGEVLQAE